MELIAELNPSRDPARLVEVAERLSQVFDWIDVPDAPLGKPNYNSPVISTFLACRGFRVIAHLRVADVNTIALKTITKTIGSLGVNRIVYLRGDPPQQGNPVFDFTPEEAVYYARTRPEAPEPGLLLSLRKSLGEIMKRLSVPAGFYFLLNLDWGTQSNRRVLEEVSEIARGAGKKLYAYLIVPGEMCGSPAVLRGLVSPAAGLIDGVVVSAPQSMECIISAGRVLRGELD